MPEYTEKITTPKPGELPDINGKQRRFKEPQEEKDRERKFSERLSEHEVMTEFIQHYSGCALNFLDKKNIKSSGWDESDRETYPLLMMTKRHPIISAMPEQIWRYKHLHYWEFGEEYQIPPWRLSSIKTLAAVYGQLCREVGYPLGKSFGEGFVDILKKAGIKKVLEVGPGLRGLVNVLVESGIAQQAGLELYTIDLQTKEEAIDAFKRQGIQHVTGNVTDVGNIFKDESFDLILAIGVMSPGGIQAGEGAESYPEMVEKSHKIADTLISVLSDNPHAMLAASSIHDTMALFQDRLIEKYNVGYWQDRPYEAHESDIRRFREWAEQNRERLEYTRKLFGQSTDLAVLKKKI